MYTFPAKTLHDNASHHGNTPPPKTHRRFSLQTLLVTGGAGVILLTIYHSSRYMKKMLKKKQTNERTSKQTTQSTNNKTNQPAFNPPNNNPTWPPKAWSRWSRSSRRSRRRSSCPLPRSSAAARRPRRESLRCPYCPKTGGQGRGVPALHGGTLACPWELAGLCLDGERGVGGKRGRRGKRRRRWWQRQRWLGVSLGRENGFMRTQQQRHQHHQQQRQKTKDKKHPQHQQNQRNQQHRLEH